MIGEAVQTRADVGLPARGFVFCCFNDTYKLRPEMFDVWMRLLHEVEGSVLWLLKPDAIAIANLRRESEKRRIDPDRIVFAERMKPPEHLARHRLADLFLDALPFGAHTTASDALWAGLPVLTCVGNTFAGRVAASLLQAIGLPDLVTHSLAEYENLALKLARDPAALADVRSRLERNRATYPLFDTVRFTRHLEAAYTRMMEIHRSGLPPAAFAVEAAARAQ
jgi:predicted O-linked N-acetylglucosamine transferase (SPINDLY family)